jgi:hypothetical protein
MDDHFARLSSLASKIGLLFSDSYIERGNGAGFVSKRRAQHLETLQTEPQ